MLIPNPFGYFGSSPLAGGRRGVTEALVAFSGPAIGPSVRCASLAVLLASTNALLGPAWWATLLPQFWPVAARYGTELIAAGAGLANAGTSGAQRLGPGLRWLWQLAVLLGSFLQPVLRQVGWVLRSACREVYARREGLGGRLSPRSRTRRCPLTWSFTDAARRKARWSRYDFTGMAFPQVPAMMIGQFVLVPRRREWDEMLVLDTIEGCPEVVAYTTTEDGMNYQWMVLRAAPGQVRVATLLDEGAEGRHAPEGVAEGSVNWICVPPTLTEKWMPTMPEMMQLHSQARAMARMSFHV